jgi:hypothetical protein
MHSGCRRVQVARQQQHQADDDEQHALDHGVVWIPACAGMASSSTFN